MITLINYFLIDFFINKMLGFAVEKILIHKLFVKIHHMVYPINLCNLKNILI